MSNIPVVFQCQTYGHRAAWEDPVDWVIDNYPWSRADGITSLHHLRHEDVGYDPQVAGSAINSATAGGGALKQTAGGNASTHSDADQKDPMVVEVEYTVLCDHLLRCQYAGYLQ